jgi:XTP/dITP diphosphohydrolase
VHLALVTGNAHKVVELAAALPGWRVEGLRLAEEPAEHGASYAENARIKALAGRSHAPEGAWVAGEDSGIEAIALGGRPGVHSARWDADGVGRMLRELAGAHDRRARYVCALVALSPDGDEVAVEGTLEGVVAWEARGSEGFGYDPIFVPEGEERTVAELGDAWKRAHSHRARAAAALASALGR